MIFFGVLIIEALGGGAKMLPPWPDRVVNKGADDGYQNSTGVYLGGILINVLINHDLKLMGN